MLAARHTDSGSAVDPTYAGRFFDQPVPKWELPEQGMPADAAYQLVHDELNLDGNPALNLASFVTSWMEPQADRLAQETLNKNLIDQDEYPASGEIHHRVVSMLARLFNAPADAAPVGTATIGSSEAIMLGVLAHKRSWQKRGGTGQPNLVMGGDVHTCWEKFCSYFDVEARVAPMREDSFTLSAEDVQARADQNTIAVAGLLGTTFTGQMDDLEGINKVLEGLEADRGWQIPLHIDAASGGFLAPFTDPKLKWDFRLSRVRSINVSNHKFGLVYPGMGTVLFRDRSDIPDELVFHINYLGGDMPNYTLNFSRPASQVILQYYNFLRLGHAGYSRIMQSVIENAKHLAGVLAQNEELELIGAVERFPIIALRAHGLDVFKLSETLRERGWIVPAYTLPPDAQHIAILRMVVKENLSRDMVDQLAEDMRKAIDKVLGRGESSGGGGSSRAIC